MRIDFEGVVNAINEGVYIVDTDRRIVFWSEGARKITGWIADEVIGRRCADAVLSHIDKDGHALCQDDFCPLHRSIRTRTQMRTPFIVYGSSASGKRIPMQVTTAPYYDDEGAVIGGIEVFRDARGEMDDLEKAAQIQSEANSLPLTTGESHEIHAISRSVDLVGGDLHMARDLGSGVVAFLLGDVTGHGVSASLYTLLIRLAWEECGPYLREPGRVVHSLHRRLETYTNVHGHVGTALYGCLDTGEMVFTYSSAAHPPFLQLHEGAVSIRRAPGYLLGLGGSAEPQQSSVPLQRGDRLLFFTDGAIEVEDSAGDQFGLPRLAASLGRYADGPPAEYLANLERELIEHCGLPRLPDDFTAGLVSLS